MNSIVVKLFFLISFSFLILGCSHNNDNANGFEKNYYDTLSYNYRNLKQLRVDNINGSIDVDGDSAQSAVRLLLTRKIKNVDESEAEIVYNATSLKSSLKGDTLVLRSEVDNGYENKVNFNFNLTVPMEMKLIIENEIGNAQILSMKNDVMIQNSIGNIMLSNLLSGKIVCEVTTGNIEGYFNYETDIEQWSFEVNTGNVSLSLNPDLSAMITCNLTTGNINSTLSDFLTISSNRNYLNGYIGEQDTDGKIYVNVVTGNISLSN